jgi:hypothetical protein
VCRHEFLPNIGMATMLTSTLVAAITTTTTAAFAQVDPQRNNFG